MNHRAFSPTPFICLCLLLSLGPGCASESEAPPPSTVAAPVISPGTGTYSAALDVAITTATADATIRYTTDGSTPTETAGTVYAAPVRIADSGTVKAVAYRTGWTTSSVTSAQYTIAPLVAAPTFTPPAGTYIPAQDVAIATTTAGAAIRYTTDGSTPTATNGTVYAGPVPVASSLTLKAVAYRAGWTTSPVTTGQYVIGLPVAAPAFDPGPGAYYDPQDVSLSTSTPGAAIRYTTDGSTPTETAGTPYAAPVHIATNLTLKAVAYRDGWRTSPVTSGDYAIGPDVSAPAFSPAPGSYSSAQSVVITTATPGSSIRYTTDGSTPTDSVGTLYSAPVPVSSSLTLRAVAYRSGWTTSTVTSGDYVITGAVAAPEFSVTPGTYSTAKTVAITSATSGATIRYTTDGSTPSETAGTVYSSPVLVDRTLTLKAVAYRAGWTTSAVTTGEYKRVGIAAGIFHTILAKADGTVWTWGGNYEGQIGDGTTTSRAEPVRITGLSGVVDVAAGYYHSIALLRRRDRLCLGPELLRPARRRHDDAAAGARGDPGHLGRDGRRGRRGQHLCPEERRDGLGLGAQQRRPARRRDQDRPVLARPGPGPDERRRHRGRRGPCPGPEERRDRLGLGQQPVRDPRRRDDEPRPDARPRGEPLRA